ncbi:sensor histidine kinase [Halodurantibacterium flavum]|uniref:histidine kinase n=1 Tax=Halodurantibacterium flavum TaxID=1382802 RepID=A0ABW4S7J3_9RHOB
MRDESGADQTVLALLAGGGETGAIVRSHDWSRTPLGPISGWSPTLLSIVGTILRSPVAMVVMWGREGVMIYNEGYARFAGDRHPEHLGMTAADSWPEARAFNEHVMATVMQGETLSYHDQEFALNRKGQPEQLWIDLFYSPIPGPDGEPQGVLAVVQETTEKVLAKRRVEGEQARLEHMFQEAPGFMALLEGPDHVFRLANRAYLDLVGRDEVVGQRVAEALPEIEAQGFVDLLDRVRDTGEPHAGAATRVTFESGVTDRNEERFVDFIFQPIRDDQGQTNWIFVEGYDVTSRVRTEQKLQVMMHELNHRLKNTIAVVQAVAAQTLRTAPSLAEAREMLDARIVALARAHEVLRGQDWKGGDLRMVARIATEGHDVAGDRVRIEGASLELSPQAAMSFSLAFHELATNSAKYGALGVAGGKVRLTWLVADDRLRLEWCETGGPEVRVPERKGFGSYLIQRVLAAELQADVTLDYRPEGLVARIDVPLARLSTHDLPPVEQALQNA